MSEKLRAHLLLLAVVAVWGGTFVMVKDALTGISPLLFNLIRMALATLCLALVYGKHLRGLTPTALISGAVAGFFLALGYQFQTAGLALTAPSKSAFITGLTVVIVPLLSAVPALRAPGSSRPRWNAFLGAVLAFAGIALLTAPGLLTARSNPPASGINLGDLLTLGCALAFAFHLLSIAHLAKRMPFEQLALLQIGFAALYMAVSSPLLERPRFHFSAALVVALLVTAVLATAAAFAVQSWAQQHLSATHTALIFSAEPLFAWLASLLFLHQGLSGVQTVGAFLILAGMALTELLTPSPPIDAPVRL
jgi:drug/metabolite transporter (DMT)-like permease